MPKSKTCQICDEEAMFCSNLLKWSLDFGVIVNDAEREEERNRISEALEACIRQLGYKPEGIPAI